MAAPAHGWGVGRALAPDPEQAPIAQQLGDMAALNLQLLQIVNDLAAANPAQQAAVQAIADNVNAIQTAANSARAREQATRELIPLTRIPAPGAINAIGGIRLHNIPSFCGNSSDSIDCVSWLDRVMTLAESHTLTAAATINLLLQASAGPAADFIRQMRDSNKTLNQIIQNLELRYGELCTPDEAQIRCNMLTRKEKENISDFIDRVRRLARMATRAIANADERNAALDKLVQGNIKRVLPRSVKQALDERILNRNRMGLPSFSCQEYEKEAIELTRSRDMRKQDLYSKLNELLE